MFKRLWIALLAGAALSNSVANGHDLGSSDRTSSHFRDDIWIGGSPPGAGALVKPIWTGVKGCADRLASCVKEIRRDDRLTSISTNASPNTMTDMTGHAVSVSGLVITVRMETTPFLSNLGIATSWSVGGEEVLDWTGTHSWERLPSNASPAAKWLPIEGYSFDNWSPPDLEPQPQPSANPGVSTGERPRSWDWTAVGAPSPVDGAQAFGRIRGFEIRIAHAPPSVQSPPVPFYSYASANPAVIPPSPGPGPGPGPSPIPEPSTWALIGVGFVALGLAAAARPRRA